MSSSLILLLQKIHCLTQDFSELLVTFSLSPCFHSLVQFMDQPTTYIFGPHPPLHIALNSNMDSALIFLPNQKQLMQGTEDCNEGVGRKSMVSLHWAPFSFFPVVKKLGHHQLLKFISFKHCFQRDFLNHSLSPRKDLY